MLTGYKANSVHRRRTIEQHSPGHTLCPSVLSKREVTARACVRVYVRSPQRLMEGLREGRKTLQQL